MRRTVVLLLVGVVAAALVGLHAWTAPADAVATPIVLATGPGGSFVEPSIATDGDRVTVLSYTKAYDEGGGTPGTRIVTWVNATGSTWTKAVVPTSWSGHTLDHVDPATVRVSFDWATSPGIIVTAEAEDQSDINHTLGIYVWRSSSLTYGSWEAPVRVFDSFGGGDVAPDGSGGFWVAAPENDGKIVHIPADLSLQTAASAVQVTTRTAGALTPFGLANVWTTPILAFKSNGSVYEHTGTTGGEAADTVVFGCDSDTGPDVPIYGNGNVWVGADHPVDCDPTIGAPHPFFVRNLGSSGPNAAETRLSTGDVASADLTLGPISGTFMAAWYDDSAGSVDFSGTAGITPDTYLQWQPPTIVTTAGSTGWEFFDHIKVSLEWVAGTAYRPSDGQTVLWVAPSSGQDPAPTPSSSAPTSQAPPPTPTATPLDLRIVGTPRYHIAGGRLDYRVLATLPGTGTETVSISARSGVRRASFHVRFAAGTAVRSLTLPRALRRLAGSASASLRLRLDESTSQGAAWATSGVHRTQR